MAIILFLTYVNSGKLSNHLVDTISVRCCLYRSSIIIKYCKLTYPGIYAADIRYNSTIPVPEPQGYLVSYTLYVIVIQSNNFSKRSLRSDILCKLYSSASRTTVYSDVFCTVVLYIPLALALWYVDIVRLIIFQLS